MNYESEGLRNLLRAARGRRRLLLALRGAAICLGAGAGLLLLMGWAAHHYRHNAAALVALRLSALTVFLAAIYLSLVRPFWKRITDARLARLIEERTPGADDRLVTAVEFSEAEHVRRTSSAIVARLMSDADQLAATINLDRVIQRHELAAYGFAAIACLLLFAGVLKWGPREVAEGVTQLVTPSSFAAAPNAMSIKVRPGTARVPKGSDQDVIATLINFDNESVTFYSRPAGGKDTDWQGQLMEPAKARSEYKFSIFNIQDSAEYFIESNGIRSEVFKLDVVDLPFVKQLDLVLNYPAYTRLPAKTIEDGGDIAALKGTVANITAHLTGKVKAARIVLRDEKKIEMRASGTDFIGAINIAGESSYYIELLSLDGETYRGSNEYDITTLEDQPPTITFERPGRDTKATNLEEVFTQAHAEDDYGVASIEMYFSVNGSEEKKVDLQNLNRDAARTLTGTHTFFLEEFNLKPGDFVSYYAKARDASHETTSDIYFIEIKPFEMQYRQSQQQGGGGGQDQDQNALSRRQKDLIAATHRLLSEGNKYTPQERADGYEAVAAGQEKLRTDVLELLDRIGRRLGDDLNSQKDLARMTEHLKQAAREMETVPPPLRKQTGQEAIPPEQRALQQLLAADALVREMQVAFGNQNGGGGSSSKQNARELTDLFDLELDKMKNQYETVQRQQQQAQQQAKSEAERRLEELARRQQQALEQQRRRQQQGPLNGASSGGGMSQREQQELADETRRAARELERLSRERRDAQLQEMSRQLNQAADEMQRAQASGQSNSGNDAIAQGQRALDRLNEARRHLQQQQQGGSSSGGGSQQIGDLRQRAAEAAGRQREIAKDVENLARRGGQNGQDAQGRNLRQQLAERKDALADSINNLQQDIEQTARSLGDGKKNAARQLGDAAEGLKRDRVADRIRGGKQGLENNQLAGASAGERAIQQSLNQLSERLQAAEQNARTGSGGASGEEALDRTRQLADNLESLRRRLEESNSRRNGQPGGQQRNQQSRGQGGSQNGQQQGQSQARDGQQPGQSQSGQQNGQSQSGRNQQGQSQQNSTGGGGNWDDDRQLTSELRERLRDAENLRREWGGTGGSNRTLDAVIDQLRHIDAQRPGESETAKNLKEQVIDPLRQLELDLSRRLQEQLGRTNLKLTDEGAAPARYRKSVEEYYRRLSGGGRRQ